MNSKSCGNCRFFRKSKNDQYSGGICDAYDSRTNTDAGHECKLWKGKKYNRSSQMKISVKALDS